MNPQAKNESAETPPEELPTRRERLREFWTEVLEGSGNGGKVLVGFLLVIFTAGSAWLLLPDQPYRLKKESKIRLKPCSRK